MSVLKLCLHQMKGGDSSLAEAEEDIAASGGSLHAEEPEGEQDEEVEDDTEHLVDEPEEGPTEEGPGEKADDDTMPAPAEVEVNSFNSCLSMSNHALVLSNCQCQGPFV